MIEDTTEYYLTSAYSFEFANLNILECGSHKEGSETRQFRNNNNCYYIEANYNDYMEMCKQPDVSPKNIFNFALSDYCGETSFTISSWPGNSSIHYSDEHYSELTAYGSDFITTSVKCYTYAYFIECIIKSNIDVLVLDIEGHECNVLKSMLSLPKEKLPKIICIEAGYDWNNRKKLLSELGYILDFYAHNNAVLTHSSFEIKKNQKEIQKINKKYPAFEWCGKVIFENEMCPKITVHNIYMPETPFWGIGDYLRGSLSIAGICEENGYGFALNYSHHPISTFLTNEHFCDIQFELNNIPVFHTENAETLTHILKDLPNEYINEYINIPLSTNIWQLNNGVSEKTRNFMRESMIPTSELDSYIHAVMQELGISEKNYTAVHVRMGDDFLIDGKTDNYIYERIATAVKTQVPTTKSIVLFSDDVGLKDYMKSHGFLVSPIVPCHLSGNSEEIMDRVKGTLCDYFCLARSVEIYKWSHFGYGSGFVDWCADIYNVPTYELEIHEVKKDRNPVMASNDK